MKNLQSLTKHEILQWANQKACCEYKSIEELGDCVAYLGILEAAHPKAFGQKKVKCKKR